MTRTRNCAPCAGRGKKRADRDVRREEGGDLHDLAGTVGGIQRLEQTKNPRERCLLQDRIRMLSTMVREARELAVLTEHYYDRGYRRNVRYTV